MKTKRRHELHTNVLADWLGQKMEKFQPYFGWIAAAGIAVVLGILAYVFFSGRSEDQMMAGWDTISKYSGEATAAVGRDETATFQAATTKLKELATQNSGSPLAEFAEASLGDLYLFRGQTLMWVRRSDALESLGRALEHYNKAISLASDPLIKNRLQLNVGTTHEWMFELDKARAAYEKVDGIYKPAAQQQLAALNVATEDNLFDRLKRFEPAPPSQPKGSRPDTEFGNEKERVSDWFNKPRDSSVTPDDFNAPPGSQSTSAAATPTNGKGEKPDAPPANQPTGSATDTKK